MLSNLERLRRLKSFIGRFVEASALSYSLREGLTRRVSNEYALMLAVLGDLLGLPLPSYYKIRLLPYWVPFLGAWKRRFLRERDILDKLFAQSEVLERIH